MKYIAVLALIAIVFIGATFQIAPNGDAYVDDANVEIRAPFTVGGVNNYLTGYIRPKTYSGDINIVFGFDSDIARPTNGYFSRPETITRSRVCDGIGSVNVDTKTATCSGTHENGTTYVIWSQRYDTLSGATNTIYWDETITATYEASQFVKRADINYNDKDRWYYVTNVPISPDQPITYTIEFDSLLGSVVKYDVGFYPSSYGTTRIGILQAIQNNQFYLLDPFINNTYYEIGNLTNTTNNWASDVLTSDTTTTLQNNLTLQYGKSAGYLNSIPAPAHFYNFERLSTIGEDIISNCDFGNSGGALGGGFINNSVDLERTSNNYLNSTCAALRSDITDWTIRALVQPETTSIEQTIFSRWYGAPTGGKVLLRIDSSNTFSCYTYDTGTKVASSTTTAVAGVKYDVACTVDEGSAVKIFINGVEEGSTPIGTIGSYSYVQVAIGEKDDLTGSNWDGIIDELTIWNTTTLTPSQISQLYNGGDYLTYYTFNTSKRYYYSQDIPASSNFSRVLPIWSVSEGNISLNVSCDGVTYQAATNNTELNCASTGDTLAYTIELIDGNQTRSPVVQSLTIHVLENVTNTAPNITAISFSPAAPTVSDNVIASTVYTDPEGDNGTVYAYWYINNVSVLNQSQENQTNGSTVQFTLSSTYTSVNDTVLVYMNATDGSLYTNTLNASVTISSVPTPTPTETNTPMNITIILVIVLILLSFYLGAANGNIAFIAVSFILTAAFLYLFSTGEFAAYEDWEAIYLSFGVIMLLLQMWASGRLYK